MSTPTPGPWTPNLTNTITLVVLAVGLVGSAYVMNYRTGKNEEAHKELEARVDIIDLRMQQIVLEQARSDERYVNFVDLLGRFEDQLEEFDKLLTETRAQGLP